MTEPETVAALVQRARGGDTRAWELLVGRYLPLVRSVASRFALNGDDMADVSQTLWLKLVVHLDDIREPRALPGWIATTVRHEALRLIKARGRMLPSGPMLDWDAPDDEEIDGALLRDERRRALVDAMAGLRPSYRALMTLLLVDPPLSYDEIAARLQMPKGSIGPTRGRALEQMRAALAVSLGQCGSGGVVARSHG